MGADLFGFNGELAEGADVHLGQNILRAMGTGAANGFANEWFSFQWTQEQSMGQGDDEEYGAIDPPGECGAALGLGDEGGNETEEHEEQ